MIFSFDSVSLIPRRNSKPFISHLLTEKLANFNIF